MFFFFKRKSFANDYLFTTSIVIAGVIVLCVVFSIYIYFSQQQIKNKQLIDATNRIAQVLNDSFDYTTQLGNFIGSQIVDLDSEDPDKIAKLLGGKAVSNEVAKKLFALTIFDWANKDNKLVVSGPYGLLKNPYNIAFRNYAKQAPLKPWKLHFDLPTHGIPSGQHVIPAGMGITDNNKKFIGTLALGFNIGNFFKEIQGSLPGNNGISYVILANDFTPILKSLNTNNRNKDREFYVRYITNQVIHKQAGFLSSPVNYEDNITYQYYRKLSRYPFTVLVGFDQTFLQNEMNGILIPSIAEFICIGSISMLVLTLIRRQIVNPIIRLGAAADQISRGEKNVTLPQGYSVELDNLSHHLQNIVFYMEELRNTQIALKTSLHETELARAKIKEMNDSLEQKVIARTFELEKALQSKTEFLNNMSHEIKTPVHGVINFADLLVEDWDLMSNEKRLDFAVKIQKNSDRLYSLVSNLLDLSQLSVSKMQFVMAKCDLTLIVKGIIEECEPLYMGNKDLKLILEVIPETLSTTAIFDAERITQVVRNLFSNAIKFTSRGNIIAIITDAQITYADGRTARGLSVEVRDEGIGIPEEELHEIFYAFSQSSRTKTKAGGTGLGLSICYEIIMAHKGSIWATNNPAGGASVTFIIPYQ